MDFLTLLPLDIGTVIISLVNALLAFIAIVVADKFIAHEIDIKSSLAMSLITFFIVPIIGTLISSFIPLPPFVAGAFFTIILPLIVWVGLGEMIIKSEQKIKLMVLAVAFAVYYILSLFIAPYIHGIIASFLPVF